LIGLVNLFLKVTQNFRFCKPDLAAMTEETKGGVPTQNFKIVMISLCLILAVRGVAAAGGPFGPPQPISKAPGGLHTGIGYWHDQDLYKNGTEHVVNQDQIYSEIGYGFKNYWEIYGRFGVADLKVTDAFRSQTAATITSKSDFYQDWNFLGTLGAKGFYPFNKRFGVGAFLQGSYQLNDASDTISGTQGGVPFTAELRVKNRWDMNFGIGLQSTLPYDVKLYLGPYVYYAEEKIWSSATIPGLAFPAGDTTLRNKTNFGGFAGVDLSMAMGFHLNLEGRYAERLSAGAAVTYAY